MQRLGQLETDDASSHHRHGVGQRRPVEDIVVDDQTITQPLPPARRNVWRRARGDDDAGRVDTQVVVHAEHAGRQNRARP